MSHFRKSRPLLIASAYPGLDTSVLRIDTSYNTQGLQDKVTSYSTTAGNTVVNQVQNRSDELDD
jgi:hypothetical protein